MQAVRGPDTSHVAAYACKDQIREFTLPGDQWVFGVYDWLAHKLLVERFSVTA
jgi:hypothetical protein